MKHPTSSGEGIMGGLAILLALSVHGMANLPSETDNKTSLRFVQVIFRHGDRAPTGTYPNDPYKNNETVWPEGMAQLTSIGKMQQYNLGRYLRDRYDGFIGVKFHSREVYGLSSDMDRTIMSLESNLAGLFPPVHKWHPKLEWQPIPLRTIPWKEDKYLHSNYRCPKYDDLHRDFLKNSAIATKVNQENKEFVKLLSQKSGIDGSTVKDIISLQDILHVQWLHNLSLPEWGLKALPRLTELQAQLNAWPTFTDEMKRLRGGPLLDLLFKKMQAKAGLLLASLDDGAVFAGGKNSKILLYSAHDSTLSRIMNTLGIFFPHNPPYAAALIFELHLNESTKSHYVKIFYRNDTTRDPYPMSIPSCEDSCDLLKMIKIYKHLIPGDLASECKGYGGGILGSAAPWIQPFSNAYGNIDTLFVLAVTTVIILVVFGVWLFIMQLMNCVGSKGRFLRHKHSLYERI